MIFETVAQLKLATLTAGQLVSTKGYYASGDGGAADYIVAATQAVDGYGDHALAGGTVALLQIDGEANVLWFGAVRNGVTDDQPSIQAALDRTPFIYLPSGNYAIYDVLRIRGETTADVEYFGVRGFGRESTRILQKDNSKSGFNIEKSELNNDLNKWMTGGLSDFSVVYVGAVKADLNTAVIHTSCLGCVFENLNIEGATRGFASFGCGQTVFSNVLIKHGQRPALEGPEFDYLFTNNGTLSRSFGIAMSNCEVFEAPLADVCLELRAVDGLYVNNCHFNSAINKVRINIDNVDLRDVVKQVFFNNVYFDGNTDAQLTELKSIVYVQSSGVANSTVDGLYFNNCVFRTGTSVFSFNVSNITGLEFFRDLFISNCNVRGMSEIWVNLVTGDSRELAVISNTQISSNVFEDAPLVTPTDNLNCIAVAGENTSITGNVIKGQWVDGVASPILVSANANNAVILGNILDTERSGTSGNKSIVINGSATNITTANNVPIEA